MNIVFQHHGVLPVERYGGTERIIFWLMKALVQLGHSVSLIGHPQSQVGSIGAKLIPIDEEQKNWINLIPSNTDLVHLFYKPQEELPCPYLVTIEGNGQLGESFPLNTSFVSKKHAENHGSECFVYNGLDFSEYPFSQNKKNNRSEKENFLFLAKAKWKVKNLSDCVWACKKAKKPLHIAGGRAPLFSRISPLIHSYGMVNQEEKLALLSLCHGLLFPVRWHEPFGIAVIEAMALGLPVFASPFGSLPELVNPQTGRICSNHHELLEAVQSGVKNFDPQNIRKIVEEKFSANMMAENYLKIYHKVCRGEKLNSQVPKWQLSKSPQELLDY